MTSFKRSALFVAIASLSCLLGLAAPAEPAAEVGPDKHGDGIYAEFVTDAGTMLLRLHYDKVPMTVINFISLAEGTGLATTRQGRFYDGLTFHRCISNFMIQGGCPDGRGTGGPGYKFADEFHPDLQHDGPGVLAMANSGRATNGSQFYITHKATGHLNNRHTVFGRIVTGQNVVNTVTKGTKIKKVNILHVGDAAKAFKTDGDAFKAAKAAAKK